jgi:RNA polymerase sigma-70 factor (ECF subfamily)
LEINNQIEKAKKGDQAASPFIDSWNEVWLHVECKANSAEDITGNKSFDKLNNPEFRF